MKHIPYATQWIDESDIKAVTDVLRSSNLTQGPRIKEFEQKVAEYCGAKYAIAVNSGTSALHLACLAAGISNGDEVITSPITFVASANCVLYCGGRPVFADVLKDTINIDPREIEKKITKKTKAIIPVHFSGNPCDLEEIQAIAKNNNLLIIEDATHALGAKYKGSKIGSCKYSDMAILSFHPVKHITTGEGGMVLTNDPGYYEKLLMFRTHGITRNSDLLENKNEGSWYYEMCELGYNNRITDIQCALGISQLGKIDKFVKKRREIAQNYIDAFNEIHGITMLKETARAKSSYHLFIVLVKNRRAVHDKLRALGINVNVHYMPVYSHPYYQKVGYGKKICPIAENYYEMTISLPVFPKLSDSEQDFVVRKMIEIINN